MTPKLGFLIFLEYTKRRRKAVLSVFIAFTLLLFLNSKLNFINFQENSITEGIMGTYQEHDLPETVTKLLSSGLTEFNEQGYVVSKLADSWESNKEASEFKFKLKEGLLFVDGSPVKSSDLEFVIPDVEVSYPNDQTILFKLKDSFVPFPSLLTKPLFKKGTLLGTGPYQIQSIEKSRIFITKIKLKSNKKLPKVIIRFYPNEKTAKTAFQLGEIQSLMGINNLKQEPVDTNLKTWQKTDYEKIVTVLFNTKDLSLSSKSLRKSLSYATSKIEGELQAKTSISPKSWSFSNPSKEYIENKEEAKQAFARTKETVSKESLEKEIILTTVPQFEEIGKKIVENWKELGLNVKLRIESGIPQNFQALLITLAIPQDPDQYHLWHSTKIQTNLSKYSSPRVDKDLEDGRKTISEEERKASYADFQKILLEDAPATFLYFPKYNVIYSKKIEKQLFQILPIQLDN